MPVKRAYQSLTVNVTDGGRLLPDLPPSRIGAANYDEKINFTRGDAEETKIAGWDFPAPTPEWDGAGLTDFHDGLPAEAIREVRRANGAVAIVGCGAGFIKYFDLTSDAWVTIGSGFSTKDQPGFRFWQIEDIANYAIFNNARDLMCTWQIGDPAVIPLYEFREQGYASCGDICAYNGILRCADILEINDDDQSGIMNGSDPFGTIVDGPTTTRINYRQLWSNINNPRDFAASTLALMFSPGDIIVLQQPMFSFNVGDEIYINGAGPEGGVLKNTIVAISPDHKVLTLQIPPEPSFTNGDVYLVTAKDSIVGSNDLGDDSSAIVRQMVLKNRLVSIKASGHVFEEYYNGQILQPFIAECMTKTPRALRFPRAIVNVLDKYLLFPGDTHFYRYSIGSQDLSEDSTVFGAKRKLFFSRVAGLDKYAVWASDNGCVGEIYFAYRWSYQDDYYNSDRALSYNYNEGRESSAEIDSFAFTCAATVRKPLLGFKADEIESWFLMGDGNGKITRFGCSNLETFTLRRYGEKFTASIGGGLVTAGNDTKPKYVRRFSLLPADPDSSAAVTVTIYGAKATNAAPVALESKVLTNPVFPGVMNLHYRQNYFKYRITSDADVPLRISGHVWELSVTETGDIDRLR